MLIIDGYNLIGRGSRLGLSLGDDGKEWRLLGLLARYRSRRGERGRFLVVFDGPDPLPGGERRASHPGLKVAYSGSVSADEAIAARLRQTADRRGVTVVSSDGEVQRRARSLGAGTLSCEEFLARVERAARPDEAEKPNPPGPGEIEEWLRRFSGGEGG